ncbi:MULTISPECIES: hypothetical protein [Rheinheimera]|jgi:hypothetical protein|uniref:hypothetical protein n=1 Tax=Rheinheimera TaxID=67575 RepID=UPI001416FF0D|nr:hypothetical protein [Rheinheimera aquimaris]MCD1597620.1 hypothetical protein [Rheinheimera aquimaris]|tara:strand:+ start:11444 stop:11620 length:177 start_codon:yes stop_codon:yes gene_type:complete
MKKVVLTTLLLLSANLVLANEFLQKLNHHSNEHTALSQDELAAQQALSAALTAETTAL